MFVGHFDKTRVPSIRMIRFFIYCFYNITGYLKKIFSEYLFNDKIDEMHLFYSIFLWNNQTSYYEDNITQSPI